MVSTYPGDLSADLSRLFALLRDRHVPYMLVGGVALLKYIEGRNTKDIDLLLSVASLASMPEIEIEERNSNFARGQFHNVPVDLLLTSNPVFDLVQRRYFTHHRFGEFDVPCASVEGLLVLKLYALPDLYFQGKLQRALLYETDIAMLCQQYRPNLADILEVIKPFVLGSQYDELTRIVAEIDAKVARMRH